MSGTRSRRKGADFECTFARRLREAMPDAGIRRGHQRRASGERRE